MWVVIIVIQGILVTEIGPFHEYNSCKQMLNIIAYDISRAYEIHHPTGYDGTKWGLSDNIQQSDYIIACTSKK